MDLKRKVLHFSIFILPALLIPFLVIACSTPSWFPIKKGSPYKAKMKELVDKEVIVIDKQEYVKVFNPKISEGKDQPKYLYIPVDEYLSKREAYATKPAYEADAKNKAAVSPGKPSSPGTERQPPPVSSPVVTILADLKKKVMVIPFGDQTASGDEVFGDWMAEKLMNEVNRRFQRILFVDYQMVKEFLEERGIPLTELETPRVLRLLNEVFGLQAVIVGELSGPYAFVTKAEKDRDETASAIMRIEMRLVDTLDGKTIKSLSAKNLIVAAKEKGAFSEEKAKIKAMNLAFADLSTSLARELDGLEWFCRIAKVEGDQVYVNAGRLTGLKVGDVMEVFRPGDSGRRGEAKGTIQISACFGVDASVGRLMNGSKPDVNDILKLTRREGV